MHLQEWPNAFYRWNIRGETPVVKIRKSKEEVLFYGGLSMKTKKVIGRIAKAKNGTETIWYLKQLKGEYKPKLKPGQKLLVVWDNASFHESEEVRAWLTVHNQDRWLELFQFPTYSPELNPQEKVWKALRKELSSVIHLKTFTELVDRACRILLTKKFDYEFF